MSKMIVHEQNLINTPAPLARELFVSPILWPAPPAVNSASQQQRIALVRDRKTQSNFTRRRIEGQHLGIHRMSAATGAPNMPAAA